MPHEKLSEESYRAMFENAGVGITRVNLDGALADINQKFCEMVGFTRNELMGRSLRELTHPDDYGQGAGLRDQLTSGAKSSATSEKRFVHRNGSIIWVRRTMSLVRDDAGNAQYVISIIEDITERKHVEQRQDIEHGVTMSLAESSSIEEAIPRVIQIVCEGLGYVYGGRRVFDPRANMLQTMESWYAPDLVADEFHQTSTAPVGSARRGGLNRAVWETNTAMWMADISQEHTLRRRDAALGAG